jgi:hypothetical protein
LKKVRLFLFSQYIRKRVITMCSPYGYRIGGGGIRMVLPYHGCYFSRPPEPEAVESDLFDRCLGCPYPRHGLFCWTDSETCLRTEMEEIYEKSRRREAVAY